MKAILRIWTMMAFTFREALARKTFVAFFALSTILNLFLLFALNVDVVDAGLAMIKVLGQDVNPNETINIEEMIIGTESVIATVVFAGGIFLSIFSTASLLPTMMEKGRIELLISKPLSRTQIMLGKYLGALSTMIFNVTYLIVGSWLILSAKTGFWYFPYLYSIPMVIAAFAVIYALMALVGVTTRSAGVSIMIAYSVLFFSPLWEQKDRIYALLSSKFYYYLLEGIYHILPKTFELGQINQALVMGKSVASWQPLWSSSIAGAAMLAVAVVIFNRKDF